MYNKTRFNQTRFSRTIITVSDIHEISDTLVLTQSISILGRNVVLTTKSGGRIELKTAQKLSIEGLDFNNRHRVSAYYTYVTSDTPEKIVELKRFLNYYYTETLYINNYVDTYEAKLDLSENTRRSMDMFKDDSTIILNFFAIKVN